MKCWVRVRTSSLWPAIGPLVWLGITTGLSYRSPSALGDQADRDLWPLRVSDDGRCFTHADGAPFFPVIDTVWMLSYLAPEEVDFYVTHRPAKGFNAVYVSLAGVERLPAGVNAPNYRGHRPFARNAAGPVHSRWFDPTSGQFTKPGPRLPNSGTRTFAIPGKNRAGQRDWVLVLADIK